MRALSIFLLLAATAFGQIRAGGNGNWGHPSGFGNILFPGTGHAPRTPGGGGSITAYRPYGGGQGRGGNVVYWPIGYPMYYQQPQQPEVIVVQAQQPQQPVQSTPSVIINQHFTPQTASNPIVREYNWDAPAVRSEETARSRQVEEEKRPYLIALRDHTIYAAFTYWMDGETLHYVTTHGTHNQVSMGLVDREFSERLNRERGVRFDLK